MKTTESSPKAPALCSQRWNLSVLCFFGLLIVYLVRINLSVAIICMVRTLRLPSDRLANQSELGDYDLTTDFPDATSLSPSGASGENQSYGRTDKAVTDEDGDDENYCGPAATTAASSARAGEFDWDKATQSRLLAMYFYGYIFTQIPGGWLAGRYGGRRVWGICQAICALCTLATPLAARANVYLMYACRFVLGLAAGVSFPCVHALFGRWAPKLERSKLVGFSFTGLSVGYVLTYPLSALLCVYGFDNGWASIFYLSGIGNLLWVVVWFLVTADTPAKHKRISETERNYIQSSIGERKVEKEKLPTPWRAIFTSGPVWACMFAHMLNNYTGYTLLTSLPTFMKEVLKFDIKENGSLSAVPYVCEAVMAIAAGQVADRLRERGILSTKNARKIFQTLSFLGSAICIMAAGFMNCTQRTQAVFLLCLCMLFMGFNRAGYNVNHIDLAPRHAGVLFGITNTAATVPGMIAPLVAGALTPNRTAEEWRRVFFVCTGLATLGAILYVILADGELQSWASPPSVEVTIPCYKKRDGECEEDQTPILDHKSFKGADALGYDPLGTTGEVIPDSLSLLSPGMPNSVAIESHKSGT